jgi:photosystem II stability/assembly factor-like uncharacterized protein
LRKIGIAILSGFQLGIGGTPTISWRWSNPQPSGENLIRVALTDSLHGLILADNGSVLETADGGGTWSDKGGRIDNDYLISAAILDSRTIIALSGFGHIWRTANAGLSWTQAAAFPSTLAQISSCGDGIVVAAGREGSIARSVDYGANWALVRQDSTGPYLLGIHCVGRRVFAVGDSGTMLGSVDEGVHWDPVAFPVPEFLTSVAFADSLHGMVTTDRGKLVETRDGGRSWKISVLDSLKYLGGVTVNGPRWRITGSDGGIWNSPDDGASWIRADSVTSAYIASAAFAGVAGGLAVGNNGLILKSGGLRTPWEIVRKGPNGYFDGLTMVSDVSWLAYGAPGMVLRTEDAGKSWRQSPVYPDSIRFLAGAFQGSRGILAGDGGTIVRSTDGGGTWTQSATPRKGVRLFGVAWSGPGVAVAVGEAGVLWRSADYGATWAEVPHPPGLDSQTLSAICFRDDSAGYIVGYGGTILHSSDHGASWSIIPISTQENLFGISFRDDRLGIAVGTNGSALISRDGGFSWAPKGLGYEDDYVFGVAWLGGDTALAVGDWGHGWFLSFTTDAGDAWTDLRLPTRKNLWALSTLGPGRVALLGQDGAILLGTLESGKPGSGDPQSSAALASFTVRRSYAPGQVLFQVRLAEAAAVALTAYSLDGRKLATVYRGMIDAGSHSLSLPFPPRGPALFRMEVSEAQSRFSKTGLLPY